MTELRCPFPYFGGKRRVAGVVWCAFGDDVPNYIEPFFGSGAVLLGRPGGAGKIETVNDRDRYVANFWRAIQADPWEVAHWADGPVNEADLHARHLWLVNQAEFRERMHTDPDHFDAKIAGWWVWGLCQWIGAGWCVEPNNHKHPKLDGIGKGVHSNRGHSEAAHRKRPELDGTAAGRGVHSESGWNARPDLRRRPDLTNDHGVHAQPRQLPALAVGTSRGVGSGGRGVHGLPAKLPHLAVKADGACAGRGILSDVAVDAYSPGRRPQLSNGGQGVHMPSLGNDRGIHGVSMRGHTDVVDVIGAEIGAGRAPPAFEWFLALSERLRRVRVACGDWTRVLGDSVLGKGKGVGGRRPCAVFLDAPYGHEFRDPYLYSEDDASIAAKVAEWAIERGDDPDLRIAVCGYAGEHAFPSTWTEHAWKASRGYAGASNNNRELERIWFSPHCLPLDAAPRQMGLAL